MAKIKIEEFYTVQCEKLVKKFILLKKSLKKISEDDPNSVLEGKIPNLKKIHKYLKND